MSLFELANFSLTVAERTLFSDVTLKLERQQTYCIETAVLDGGSSLLKCCAGIYQPSAGNILIEGKSISDLSIDQRFRNLTYCYELGGLISSFSIYDNIAFPLIFNGICKINEVKNKIYNMAESLNIGHILALEIHQINDVQVRLLNLLRALCIQPKVILIDEIQSGMSDIMIQQVIDVLREQQNLHGFSMIITTTGGDQTEFADRTFKIENQKIVEF
jgi:ABC-type lipoprotein export system ATPase subunit